MKTKFLLFAGLTFVGKMYSQISINSTDLPSVGDTMYQITDTLSQPSVGNSGVNQTWDFSTLMNHGNIAIAFLNAANTPYYSEFPTANVAAEQGGGYVYMDMNANDLSQVGLAGDPGFGITLFLKNDPNNIMAKFSMDYGDTYSNNHVQTAVFEDIIGVPNVDSLKLVNTVTEQKLVDAWGMVTTPAGTFNSLRQKLTITSSQQIYGRNNALPIWAPLGSPTVTNTEKYEWWSNDPGTGISILDITIENNTVTDINYMDVGGVVSVDNKLATNASVSVYPNPSTDFISVRGVNEKVTVSLTDITGKVVLSKVVNANEPVNVTTLASGTYFYSINNLEGKTIASEKLSITK